MGGIIPSSWRILTVLLDRIYDMNTGAIKIPELNVEIPQQTQENVKRVAEHLKEDIYTRYQWKTNVTPESTDLAELILNNTWRPCLEVIGIDGLPKPENAGNVLRAFTQVKVSIRMPPSVKDPQVVKDKLINLLTKDVPHNAHVTMDKFTISQGY